MATQVKLPNAFDKLLEILGNKKFIIGSASVGTLALLYWIISFFNLFTSGPTMANLIPDPNGFQTLVVKEVRPVLVIFFDNESSINRIKAYEKIINADYPKVLNYKVNLDDKILIGAEEKKYVPVPLICCTAICNDSLKFAQNPGETEFRELMDWLVRCPAKTN
jgi:hypothetical protein